MLSSIVKVHPKGFSLVELLVSLAIAGVIMTGVVKIAFNAKRSSYDGEQLSFVQDNARFVLDEMKRDLRMAGYTGCASTDSALQANVVSNSMGGFIDLGIKLDGFEYNDPRISEVYAADMLENTDSFLVRYADASREMTVRSHNVSAGEFSVWQEVDFAKGDTMLVTDSSCREIGLFQITKDSENTTEISHAAEGALNCSRVVRATTSNVDCSICAIDQCGANSEVPYTAGSSIAPYKINAYYIGESAVIPGLPALKRLALSSADGSAATEIEEVAVGVEDMQLVYGIDSDADGEANRYVASSAVVDWGEVVGMRMTLVFRSDREVYSQDQDVSITLNGETYQLSSDKFMRQVITTAVRVRNN
jgi:prepilin-type N-terminal cleavage/methylation domain